MRRANKPINHRDGQLATLNKTTCRHRKGISFNDATNCNTCAMIAPLIISLTILVIRLQKNDTFASRKQGVTFVPRCPRNKAAANAPLKPRSLCQRHASNALTTPTHQSLDGTLVSLFNKCPHTGITTNHLAKTPLPKENRTAACTTLLIMHHSAGCSSFSFVAQRHVAASQSISWNAQDAL